MEELSALFYNRVLEISLISFMVAQVLKVLVVLIKTKRMDFSRLMGSGGMPSSHSSFVTALIVAVGQEVGYDSPLFAVSTVMGLIVMYDASGVRRAAGKQAIVLNKIIDEIEHANLHFEERLKELLGHTPIEVFAGAILGIIIALLFY